jgi:hypothetical protein
MKDPPADRAGAADRKSKRSGLTKELRKRRYYEKPCESRRRATLHKQGAIRKGKSGLDPQGRAV